MEVERVKTIRAVSFALMVIVLLLIAVGCATTLVVASRSAGLTDPDTPARRAFAKIALLSTATLGLTLVLLVWAATHLVAERFAAAEGRKHPPTPHVDAWSVAGKRFQLDEDDDSSPEEGDKGPRDSPEA